MEEFRKTVEKRLKNHIGVGICCFILFIVLFIYTKGTDGFTTGADGFTTGYSAGMLSGLAVLGIYNTIMIYTALHNEEKLKKMYIDETDERNSAILKETAKTSWQISWFVLSAASFAAGLFDKKICITLIAVLAFIAVTRFITHAYYKRKM